MSTTTLSRSNELTHPKYRRDIDGLRALAVLSVVIFHAFPSLLPGGFIGVDIFFVISGFLISTIIIENLEKGSFSFAQFYSRRIRRIFPALLLVLIATLGFGYIALLANELNLLGKHVAASSAFIANLTFWSEVGYFDPASTTKPLLHLWSLGIEEQFYLLWPFILWLAWRVRANLLAVISVLALSSFAANLVVVKSDSIAAFYSPFTRFWELLAGAILAWLTIRTRFTLNRTTANLFSFAGFALVGLGLLTLRESFAFPGKWALFPVIGTLLLLSAGPKSFLNEKFLTNKFAVSVGLISYPLYLWHWPLLTFSRIINEGQLSRPFRMGIVLISILLAWCTTRFVEKPLRFGATKVRLKVALLSALAVAVGLSGLATYKSDLTSGRGFYEITIKRSSFKYGYGLSLDWLAGKDGWLFIGNSFNSSIEKLKGDSKPDRSVIEGDARQLEAITAPAALAKTRVILMIGPDKPSIYPEYLPDGLRPSNPSYLSYFLDRFRQIPNLSIYDPTQDLIAAKRPTEYLYYKTDTHWNYKGSYLAYSGLMRFIDEPAVKATFTPGPPNSGDLIKISKRMDLPLGKGDSWDVNFESSPKWKEIPFEGVKPSQYRDATLVTNYRPISNKRVWVVGDSFNDSLKQYFNATFKEVRYLGHWLDELDSVPENFAISAKKPDLIIIVRVQRSF